MPFGVDVYMHNDWQCLILTELGCDHRDVVPGKFFPVQSLFQEYRSVPSIDAENPVHIGVAINSIPAIHILQSIIL